MHCRYLRQFQTDSSTPCDNSLATTPEGIDGVPSVVFLPRRLQRCGGSGCAAPSATPPDGGRPTLGFALMTQPHRQPVPCRDDHPDASTRAAMVG